MMPILEHTIIDDQSFSSHTLIYVASGVALPSLQHNVYAFVLGDGGKKIAGHAVIFSPTTINKTYSSNSPVLL